jgi:hypothetical protein
MISLSEPSTGFVAPPILEPANVSLLLNVLEAVELGSDN